MFSFRRPDHRRAELPALMLCLAVYLGSSSVACALSDPMAPPAFIASSTAIAPEAAASEQTWTLTSTVVSNQRRVAVINGKVLKIGQDIDGAILRTVASGEALLEKNGKAIILRLAPTDFKKTIKRPSGQTDTTSGFRKQTSEGTMVK